MVLSIVAIAPGVCHPGLEEGLHFHRWQSWCGPWAFLCRVFDYMTCFQRLWDGVECGKQSVWRRAAGLKNKKSIKSERLIRKVWLE